MTADTPASPRPLIVLRSAEFRRGREASWRALEDLVVRIEKGGIAKLSAQEVERLPLLYRAASSSLSVARAIALDRNLIMFLENLTLRAYLIVYAPRESALKGLADYLRRGFPAAVRACRWHILLAFVAILAGTIGGYLLVMANADWFDALTPVGLAHGRSMASTAAELRREELFAPWPGFIQSFLVLANFLFEHNSQIAILAFGLGIVGGIPTLLLLTYQGLVFGAFLALHDRRGLLVDFLGWVSIHGVTEFLAIILCGAGGLVIGEKVLFPGTHSRLDNLAINGKVAANLVGGAVLMLLIAGVIEGGFRQLVDVTAGRFAFALATAVFWLVYFLSGRRRSSNGV
jgi:uncharacterized membrane protein SpoIIM required for sporulation